MGKDQEGKSNYQVFNSNTVSMKVSSTPIRQRVKAGLLVESSFFQKWTGVEDAEAGIK